MKQAAYTCLREGVRDAIIPVYEDSVICETIAQQLEYDVNALVDTTWKTVTIIHTLGKFPFQRLIFLGMGKASEMTTLRMREAFTSVLSHVKEPASLVLKHAVCETIDLHKAAE